VILSGGVAAYLLLSAHRTVIFAIAQLSCYCLAQTQTHTNTHKITLSRKGKNVVAVDNERGDLFEQRKQMCWKQEEEGPS